MNEENKSSNRQIQSIRRASDILDLFLFEKKQYGISELSKELSLAKTTIQGIVSTLVDLKYLEKDPNSQKYRLGGKLFQLGMAYAANLDMIQIARVWTERLCFKINEPVNIGVLVGSKVLIVVRVEPEGRNLSFSQQGTILTAHTSSIGKIIFAHMDPERRDAILKDFKFIKLTENSIDNKEDYLKELEEIKKTGIAFDNEENLIGLAGIAGPIFNFNGEVVAGFAITGKAKHIYEERENIINEIKYTSREVSLQMGYQE